MSAKSGSSSKGEDKNTSQPTAGKTLATLGTELGADGKFVQDGMLIFLDGQLQFQDLGERMSIFAHARAPDGAEVRGKWLVAPYLLERMAQMVTRYGKGWYKLEKDDKGARSFYRLLQCDEKGNLTEAAKAATK